MSAQYSEIQPYSFQILRAVQYGLSHTAVGMKSTEPTYLKFSFAAGTYPMLRGNDNLNITSMSCMV